MTVNLWKMTGKLFLISVVAILTANGQDLVRVPPRNYEVTDQITSLKLRVSVSEFLMGATEITQRQYREITSSSPSVYAGDTHPVENVSWWDAIRYCNLRSAKEGLPTCYNLATGERRAGCTGYRLPTEAEWIVAAGTMPRDAALSAAAHLGVSSTKSTSVFDAAMKTGTSPVRGLKANDLGLFDMHGNVWEWCGDFFNVTTSPDAVRDPSGPTSGLARVIRGGSFVSTTSRWSRDYRSSMNPDAHSRFTGFRVARSVESKPAAVASAEEFFRIYNKAPEGFASSTGSLIPLVGSGASAAAWEQNAKRIKTKWNSLLAAPEQPRGQVSSRIVQEVSQRNFAGQIVELEMEPGIWEKLYVLRPSNSSASPRPVLIVPFYDIDTPAAVELAGRSYAAGRGVSSFAYTAAQNGYVAVAVRWFGESYGESYSEAVANLALRHPGATGLGKWVADAHRVVDFIETLPDVDASRIGIMGHSLGGKMALYAAAFEPRIHAVVSSELGVGFKHSNYEDYWYLGDKIANVPPGTDQHELIGLVAPRPFLLIGGDEYDKAESWYYINAARRVYEVFGKGQNIGYFNHHTGHTPSPESVSLAFDWLNRFLKP